ncbi:4'-phosphopantetheinyl transferase superfamily protein [Vibrio sp. ZSDE26]|uniref:4'-phosphopantetheinyl transferase superfamily protein n=1 Tax=Vibrio amylolyticus TaxID=2847292 RepID=A0A9X1XJZ8_9VIBR|nr:4'-phosphopantetheinyl transferase superfamily protein [Vibrio amylolyticus]MCK6263535.1 4'-phosphopantetheinyl transferase superfamily protein [Vibrio amylolyticus]
MSECRPQVDLWLCPLTTLDESPERISYLKSFLTQDEITKVDRYRMYADRIRALYVRVYLRTLLSRYSDIEREQWRFEYGDKGKPTLNSEQKALTGLHFNISHSKDYLLIGILQSPNDNIQPGNDIQLGVDIEHTRERTDVHSIMTNYFSSKEVEDLKRLEPNEQRTRFFDLWALKESYIKATGKGLSTSLKSFSFDFSSVELQQQFIDQEKIAANNRVLKELYTGINILFEDNEFVGKVNDTNCWQSCLGRLDEEYRFAVTLGGIGKEMHIRMFNFQSKDLFD